MLRKILEKNSDDSESDDSDSDGSNLEDIGNKNVESQIWLINK